MNELVFDDGQVQLWHGRLEDVLPALGVRPDLVVADPPYGETSLAWDRWPTGWPALVAEHASSMWCFGSARLFDEDTCRDDLRNAGWKLSHDVIWEKNAPSFNPGDRFSRIHEHVRHFYRGDWGSVHHQPERVAARTARAGAVMRRAAIPKNIQGDQGAKTVTLDGRAFRTTVLYSPNVRGGIHPTEKPPGVLEPLISYGCPPGGLVLDPFAGSCSTLVGARNLGRRAIGIEMRAEQCESAVRRLEQGVLALEGL